MEHYDPGTRDGAPDDTIDPHSMTVVRPSAEATALQPWTAHTWIHPPRSRDRILLATALVQLCAGEWGLGGEAVAVAARDPASRPADAERVRCAGDLLGRELFDGRIRSWARAFGGGEPVTLPDVAWELDDFSHRMATSAIDPSRPFDRQAEPTHWIFLSEPDWEEALARLWPAPGHDARSRRKRASTEQESGTPPPHPPEDTRPETIDRGERILRLPEVLDRTGLSRPTLYRRIAAGAFPAQRSCGGNVTGWLESEVSAWIDGRGAVVR